MILWRIHPKKYVDAALSGDGGLFTSGRWHNKGNAIIYTAESQALAILESLVHFNANNAPKELVLLSIEITDADVKAFDTSKLNKNWKQLNNEVLRKHGDAWLLSNSSLLLKVPSVLSSSEYNYLINPRHDGIKKLKIKETIPFNFDDRLF